MHRQQRWGHAAADASEGKSGGGLTGAQRALNVGLHGDQLLVPVTPVVCSIGWEVERTVVAARGRVVVAELLVGAQRELLQELGRHAVTAKVVGSAVTAVGPNAGVVLHQSRDLANRAVALPRRIARRTPHVGGAVPPRVAPRQTDHG